MAKVGRKTFKLTKNQLKKIEVWASQGLTVEHIADALGVHVSTLWKYMAMNDGKNELSEAIKGGKSKAIRIMAGKLWTICMEGVDGDGRSQLGAIIFWMKNVAGWSDRQILEGSNNNPVVIKQLTELKLKGPRSRGILDLVNKAHGIEITIKSNTKSPDQKTTKKKTSKKPRKKRRKKRGSISKR